MATHENGIQHVRIGDRDIVGGVELGEGAPHAGLLAAKADQLVPRTRVSEGALTREDTLLALLKACEENSGLCAPAFRAALNQLYINTLVESGLEPVSGRGVSFAKIGLKSSTLYTTRPSTGQATSQHPSRGTGSQTALNRAGREYPNETDLRTGKPIPHPGSSLRKVPPSQRVPWGAKERAAYIKEWYDRGYSTPKGGWSGYDIHHIRPREYGGTNDFTNLVPVRPHHPSAAV